MSIRNGLTAGFVATVVLSMVMALRNAVGLMPGFDPIVLLANLIAMVTGSAPAPLLGWALHFVIGTLLWGVAYAAIEPRLPGTPSQRGMVFALGPWLVVMVVLMPLAGFGPFGLALGVGSIVTSLLQHLLFGVALGIVYAKAGSGAARSDVLPQ